MGGHGMTVSFAAAMAHDHHHVTATVTELPESRVRVEAEVAPEEVERSLQKAARALARDMRIPGFRKGKVPPAVVIGRLGREAMLDEAVRGELGHWYADAIGAAGVVTVGEPELDLGDLPEQGQPLTFSIEIGVRPTAKLGEYKGLEVGRREPEAAEEQVEREVEQLRERLARLETVERPAEQGDFVVMDYLGSIDGEPFAGGEGRDQLVELGSGRLVPGFEDQLVGAEAAGERTVRITFPDDYGAKELAGKDAEFAVTVKEVKAKQLPELDDEFASDAAGFDTLEELREDIRAKLGEAENAQIESQFREAALDAAVAEATVALPEALVEARAREMLDEMLHSLQHQGISKDMYLRISGKDEDELVEQAKPDAAQGLKREAVIAALIEAEQIEASDEELVEALEPHAKREGASAAKLLDQIKQSGRDEQLRRDVAARKAVELVAEAAKPISVEHAQARNRLWTPGKDETGEGAGGRTLWTPGS